MHYFGFVTIGKAAVLGKADAQFKLAQMMLEDREAESAVKWLDSAAEQGHIPASTFKIPNTLIALEEGVIKDQFEVIKWDGVVRQYAPWNADQTLATAFSRSCVWCY